MAVQYDSKVLWESLLMSGRELVNPNADQTSLVSVQVLKHDLEPDPWYLRSLTPEIVSFGGTHWRFVSNCEGSAVLLMPKLDFFGWRTHGQEESHFSSH